MTEMHRHISEAVEARRARIAWAVLAGVVLLAAVAVWVATFHAFSTQSVLGIDKATHDAFAMRWWHTGSMYLPAQMTGPFDPQPLPHVPATMPSMYPPTTVLLFAAFAIVPALAWWALPLGAIACMLARWRPAPWTWPILAAVLVIPSTSSAIWVGNTTMWAVAGVAVGLEYGWAGPLLLLKPSLAPFALAGAWRGAWVVGLVGVVALSLPLAGEWAKYVEVIKNAEVGVDYSLGSVPVLVAPVLAWAARRGSGAACVHRRAGGSGSLA